MACSCLAPVLLVLSRASLTVSLSDCCVDVLLLGGIDGVLHNRQSCSCEVYKVLILFLTCVLLAPLTLTLTLPGLLQSFG